LQYILLMILIISLNGIVVKISGREDLFAGYFGITFSTSTKGVL